MATRSDRIDTDNGDTLLVTKWADKSITIDVIEDKSYKAIEVTLTQRDLEELSTIIHRHDE